MRYVFSSLRHFLYLPFPFAPLMLPSVTCPIIHIIPRSFPVVLHSSHSFTYQDESPFPFLWYRRSKGPFRRFYFPSDDNDRKTINQLKVPCLLNQAACLLQMQDYARAKIACDKALFIDSRLIKARPPFVYYYASHLSLFPFPTPRCGICSLETSSNITVCCCSDNVVSCRHSSEGRRPTWDSKSLPRPSTMWSRRSTPSPIIENCVTSTPPSRRSGKSLM